MKKISELSLHRARCLRKNLTDPEKKLWYWLRDSHLNGFRFRKQVPMGSYIVDFVCYKLKLIVEVDGGQHNEARALVYDEQRTQWLEKRGYLVKRYWNNEVLEAIDSVLDDLVETVLSRASVLGCKLRSQLPPP